MNSSARRSARQATRRFGAVVVVGLLALAPAPGEAAPSPADDRRAAELERRLGPGVSVSIHGETGAVRFIGTSPGRPLPRPAGISAGAPPALAARAFLDRHGAELGIPEPARQLRSEAVGATPGGGWAIRFGQLHRGVPVLGGELVVNLDPERSVLAVSGETLAAGEPELQRLEVSPAVTPKAAERAALGAVARASGIAGDLDTGEPALQIYDSRLLGGPGLDRPALVWSLEVRSGSAEPLRELVLVDAQRGSVALRIDRVPDAKNRLICDAANSTGHYPCTTPARTEGAPPHAVADVNQAYDFSGDTYDFFFDRFGRDSLDGAGMDLVSTVRWCESAGSCPYENAFWDGEQMVYGEGFAVDDVVGHELTHGVTEFSSKLFYYYQSGAINESLSDVFGEFVDLTNGAGTDTAAVRWLVGEDLPPSVGVIRNMKDPTAFGDPDRMTSPNYRADANELDAGGVHSNSGVNNKAAYLMTDGDTFNGRTVTGLGIDKVARIYYQAQTALLTSASDYADLHDALGQACANLVGIDGITAADCVEVDDAVAATEMDVDPPAAPAPHAPTCQTGTTVVDSFFDNLENPASGNWAATSILGANGWYYPQNTHPYDGFDATYATSGTRNFWGDNQDTLGDFAIAMTADVTVPAGGFLRFEHAHGFEDQSSPSRAWDGGVVEYSTDGGATWTDAGDLFTHNGYTGTIYDGGGANNPLQGREAFVRESNGYISSRVDLGSLAGEQVRFRFRIGTDSFAGDYGWFIDDVRIYRCDGGTAPPAAPTITATVPASPANDNSPGVRGTVGSGSPTEVKVYANATCAGTPEATGSVAQFTGPDGIAVSVADDTTTALSARAADGAGNDSTCSNSMGYVEDSTAPAAPSITGTDPASPSADDRPLVKGSSSLDTTTVEVFTQASCAGSPASGSRSAFGGSGIEVAVAVDQTTQLSARARDAAGNVSSCSGNFAYTHDSIAPAAPTITATVPASPANDESPGVRGTVGSGSPIQVKVYANATCSGTPDAAGSVAQFTGADGISVAVPANATTALSARAADGAGNDSSCSNSMSYLEDSIRPQTQIGFPDPGGAYTSASFAAGCADEIPDVCGSASDSIGLDAVQARLRRASDGFYWNGVGWQLAEIWLAPSGTSSWMLGLDLEAGTYTLSARATDTAGNLDLTPASRSFTIDDQAPTSRILNPRRATRDRTPKFRFAASESPVTFRCAVDRAGFRRCKSPHVTKRLAYGRHRFRVRAIDEAGNRGPAVTHRFRVRR